MILISHRGNVNGPTPAKENTWPHINVALSLGFDVEVDVWEAEGNLWLGHDAPLEPCTFKQLQDHRLWCHAKNAGALEVMLKNGIHCFWHGEDAHTMTSIGNVWTYPGVTPLSSSICVVPEAVLRPDKLEDRAMLLKLMLTLIGDAKGVCSDYVNLLSTHYGAQKS